MSTNDNRLERLQALPKAELHIHIEGSLEPDLAYAMASRNGATLPFGGAEELPGKYKFDNLQDFLNLYYLAMSGLQNETDFLELGRAYGARAVNEGVRHAEVFFDPQAHLVRGVKLGSVLGGLSSALDEMLTQYGVSGGLILCFLRDRPVREARETLDLALSEHPESIIGVGLDSSEIGYPPRAFCEVFREARSAGLRLCAHAGEEGPPSYIWEALDELGVDRVDHGIRAVEDPVLVERLANDGTPLTVCPLSNVRLRACDSMEAHPILALLEKGVHVTINSDDPAYFGGYITANYAAVSDFLGMTEVQAGQIARNSVDASFALEERKELLLAEIEAWERAIAPE